MNSRIWLCWVIIPVIVMSGCATVKISSDRPQNSSFLVVSISTGNPAKPSPTNTITPIPPTSTSTPTPIATITPTAIPTDTPTSTIIPVYPTHTPTPTRIVIGGADKIAYLNGNEIWIADLDGSDLTRLSFDGKPKTNLQWSPDGQAIIYIAPQNKCVYSISIENAIEELITCFTFAQYFRAFEISPDGNKVAISLDNLLYILPYDIETLRSIEKHGHLSANAVCEYYDPLQNDPDQVDSRKNVIAKFIRWSRDGQRLAFVTHGFEQDIIKFIEYNDCQSEPVTYTTFYPDFFLPTPELYVKNPVITNFGWDGNNLVSIIAIADRDTDFGTLYIYDSRLKKAYGPFEGISNCCYRDPIYSPDGNYLAFAYKEYLKQNPTLYYDLGSNIELYMIQITPNSEFGLRGNYAPLPLPSIESLSQPQAVLRPVMATSGPTSTPSFGELPEASLTQNTICWSRPSYTSAPVNILLAGENVYIKGRDVTNNWVLILRVDNPCWIPVSTMASPIDLDTLSIVSASPTPTSRSKDDDGNREPAVKEEIPKPYP